MGKSYFKTNFIFKNKEKGEKTMFKAKQKIASIVVAFCALVVMAVLGCTSLFVPQTTALAEPTEIVFNLGANGSASHNDGTSKTSYTETVSGYTLSITSGTNMYTGARDAKGNSCIKLGTSKKVGSFQFIVPDAVTSVVIAVGKYKANTTKITVNGTSYTISGASDNGAYDNITVDTTSTKTVSFTTVASNYRAMVNTITYIIESNEPACEHDGETEWTYDAETKEHYEKCLACDAEIEGSRERCVDYNDFEYGEYTTTDGVHTRTLTCQLCNGKQTESGDCQVSEGEWIREGNTHSKTGTCTVCQVSTSVTEDCTLTYENISNEDGTHNTTSTCSVCEQSSEPETVNCTFDEGVLDGTTLTYTCKYCGYSYTKEATTYTITYVVPNGVKEVEVAEGFTTELAEAAMVEGYTFIGWVATELDEKTETAPEFLEAGAEYKVTADATFYALYSYAEGTGAWTKVTDATDLEDGKKIIITNADATYAMGTNGGSYSSQVEITKNGDSINNISTAQIITLEQNGNLFYLNVGDDKYLCSANSGNNLKTSTTKNANSSWSISISNGVAAITAQAGGSTLLQYNARDTRFSCYKSTSNMANGCIYMKDGATYYVTKVNTCAHENKNEVIEKATCTKSGSRTVTCLDCEAVVEAEILPAFGHDYVDGFCQNEGCGLQEPSSIVYDGYYYLILNGKYLDTTTLDSNDRYKPVVFTPDEMVEWKHVFYFVKSGETYDMYDMTKGLYMEGVTITTNNDYSVNIYNSEGNILSHNTSANYVGFYKTSNNYPKDFTFTEVEAPATIDSASITIGEDITLNYYVIMSDVFAGAEMHFTVEDRDQYAMFDVKGVAVDGRYVFSLNLAPQYMSNNVKAELVFNELTLASKDEYSIKTYAQNQLNAEDSSDELKQLLTDLLYYGKAAQNYKNYNTENLATAGVENLGEASMKVPTTTDFTLVKNKEIDSYPAYFKSAGVYFDNVNKIYVKLSTTENVTLTINGVEVAVEDTTVYTDGILATGFADTYTFVLSCDGVVMQTLTYSVNAYAFAKKDSATMGELALALYNYGLSAKACANA